MCLMLYLGTRGDLPLLDTPVLKIEAIDPGRAAVRQWFTPPTVRFIGAHTGCSCGFPHAMAEGPVDFFKQLWDLDDERPLDLQSAHALINLLRQQITSGDVELYAVWDGDEHLPPTQTAAMSVGSLEPETFFVIERFFYRVSAAPGT